MSHTTLPAGLRVGETCSICPPGDGPGLAWSAAWLRTNKQPCCGHQDLLEHPGSYGCDSRFCGDIQGHPATWGLPHLWKLERVYTAATVQAVSCPKMMAKKNT